VGQRQEGENAAERRRSYLIGIAAVLAAALCWSTGGLLIKLIDLSPLKISLYRSFIAGLFLMIVAGRGWGSLPLGAAGVILSYAILVNLFVMANKWTTAANAILLQSTAPVWVILLGLLIERVRPRGIDLVAVAGALGGLLLVLAERVDATGGRGNLAALVSGVFFALMMLLMRRQRATPLLQTIALGNMAAVLLSLPWVWPDLGLTVRQATLLGVLGVGQLGLGYLFFTVGIRRLPTLEVSLLALLEPVLNPVWVFLGYGEEPGKMALAGGVIVVLVLALHAAATARLAGVLARVPRARAPLAPPSRRGG
jgi:drug/metabolite transporter (DMT)-like permease